MPDWMKKACLGVLLSVATPLYASDWTTVPGAANDIGVGADGTAWAIGTKQVPGGYRIWRWDGDSWAGVRGGAVRISVDPSGNAWVVNSAGRIYRYDGSAFRGIPTGRATDIGVGADGSVWVIGSNKVSGGYGIYRWTGRTWTRVPGGAVRIAVDRDGNAWVVNSGGGIYRYDGRRFVRLPGAAKDIGAGADGSVWVTTANGDIYKWDENNWKKQIGSGVTIAVGGRGEAWVVDSANRIHRSSVPGVVVQNAPKIQIYTEDPPDTGDTGGNVDITTGDKIVIEGGGGIEVPGDPGGDAPSLLPEGTGEEGGVKLGPGQSIPTPNMGDLTVLAPTVTTDYFGTGWARTTGAAQGEKSFKEPGLTPFLLVGALPILNSLYEDPATLAATLRLRAEGGDMNASMRKLTAQGKDIAVGKSPSASELRFLRDEYVRVAQNPVDNAAIKGMMGLALISAARKAPHKRSEAEKALVSHFERYMQRRKLFIAERAQYLYNAWIQREMMKRKSQVAQIVDIPQIPPDVINEAKEAAELTAKGLAVASTVGTAVAGGILAYSSVAIIGAVAPFAADAGAGLFVVSGIASSSASSAVAALAGPVGIVAAGIVVIAISIDQVVKAEEYRKQVARDVQNARKPIDLRKLASTDDGLDQIRYYWALATGVDEPDVFRGAPAAAFRLPANRDRYDLDRIPSSASGLGIKGGLDLFEGMKGVKVVNNYGVKHGPIEAAWRSYAVAYNNCFAIENILLYQTTGAFSCPPRQPTWSSIFKRGKFPPNALQPAETKLPPEMWAVQQWVRINSEREGICRFVTPGGATVGTYKGGRCHVADEGRRRTVGSNFTVLRADAEQVKWQTRRPRGTVGWVPLNMLNTVEAGIRSDGSKVAVCRSGKVPGWIWRDQCHIVIGNSATSVPLFDVLVSTAR